MADFQNRYEEFAEREARIFALSVDDHEDARAMVKDQGLIYAVGYGVDAREVSARTGAFYQGEKNFLHASGYLLNRKGKVIVAAYSTGAIGRLVPQDCLDLIDHLEKQ